MTLRGAAPGSAQLAQLRRVDDREDGPHRIEVGGGGPGRADRGHDRIGRERLVAGDLEDAGDERAEVAGVADKARQLGGGERVPRIDPQPQPGHHELALRGVEQAHLWNDRRDVECGERVRDQLALLVGAAQHGDIARHGRADAPAIAHAGSARQQVPDSRGGGRGEHVLVHSVRELEGPILEARAEPRWLRGERRQEPRALLGHAVMMEGTSEDVAREIDERGAGSIGGGERLDGRRAIDRLDRLADQVGVGGGGCQRLDHRIHQRRIRAAEAVDRLLLITDPHGLARERGELEEDRELEWAGVLELVDKHEIDLTRERRPHVRATEQLQCERLLVDEVDHAALALVLLICVGPFAATSNSSRIRRCICARNRGCARWASRRPRSAPQPRPTSRRASCHSAWPSRPTTGACAKGSAGRSRAAECSRA